MEIHALDEDSKDFPSIVARPINIASMDVIPSKPIKPYTNRKWVILHGVFFFNCLNFS